MKRLAFLLILVFHATGALPFSCRDSKVKQEFDKTHGYPNGRKGYIVDHICPLSIGGLDIIENMQYQTIRAAKAKDKIERTKLGKEIWCDSTNSLPTRTVYNCNKQFLDN